MRRYDTHVSTAVASSASTGALVFVIGLSLKPDGQPDSTGMGAGEAKVVGFLLGMAWLGYVRQLRSEVYTSVPQFLMKK